MTWLVEENLLVHRALSPSLDFLTATTPTPSSHGEVRDAQARLRIVLPVGAGITRNRQMLDEAAVLCTRPAFSET